MVRFFDPTRSDPSLFFIKSFQSYLEQKENHLSEEEIRGAIKVFLRDPSYTKMKEEYISKKADFPDFVIRDRCPTKKFVISPYTDYSYYKSYYDSAKNQICICSNFLSDLLDLKENIDRELVVAYDKNIKETNLEDDEAYACTQIRACRKQYQNYTNTSDEFKKNLSSVCGRYLLKVILK